MLDSFEIDSLLKMISLIILANRYNSNHELLNIMSSCYTKNTFKAYMLILLKSLTNLNNKKLMNIFLFCKFVCPHIWFWRTEWFSRCFLIGRNVWCASNDLYYVLTYLFLIRYKLMAKSDAICRCIDLTRRYDFGLANVFGLS